MSCLLISAILPSFILSFLFTTNYKWFIYVLSLVYKVLLSKKFYKFLLLRYALYLLEILVIYRALSYWALFCFYTLVCENFKPIAEGFSDFANSK